MTEWRPSAPLDVLAARADLFAQIRDFFVGRGLMEVETPLLCQSTVTDPSIRSFTLEGHVSNGEQRFLQASPEFAMKRLLAAGVGDIFQISKAFRLGEEGPFHNPEFSLLEWYRINMDHRALIREVAELVCQLLGRDGWQVWPYRALFLDILGIDPLLEAVGKNDLLEVAESHIESVPPGLDYDSVLDLLMSHCIEPAIYDWGVVFVTDYPPTQSALARLIKVNDTQVAARFECYVDGCELANGYWEQCDVLALKKRFKLDLETRAQRLLPWVELDSRLLGAHKHGLPDCAGVALGLDRMLALRLGLADISQGISFDWSRA